MEIGRLRFPIRALVGGIGLAMACCAPAVPERSQAPAPPPPATGATASAAELDALVPDLMARGRVPGLSIAVIRGGEIVWQGAFGVKSTGTGEPVTTDTIFEAASLTKPLFAYLVLQLVDEGLLELDVPLVDYVPREEIERRLLRHSLDHPEFRHDWFERITARQVLSHSSGMPHGEQGDPYPLLFEPGTRFKYSAAGYYYLQLAVEHLTGEKLEETVRLRVLDPLGMTRSSMVWRDGYEATAAHGHDRQGGPQPFRRYDRAHAAASLYTTAGDYARFVRAVLRGEQLRPATWTEMLSPQVDIQEGLSWSLGFGLQRDEKGEAFWQWGDYEIFRNFVIAYPERLDAVVYLTNSYHGLSIGADLVRATVGGAVSGLEWLGYERYDARPDGAGA